MILGESLGSLTHRSPLDKSCCGHGLGAESVRGRCVWSRGNQALTCCPVSAGRGGAGHRSSVSSSSHMGVTVNTDGRGDTASREEKAPRSWGLWVMKGACGDAHGNPRGCGGKQVEKSSWSPLAEGCAKLPEVHQHLGASEGS